MRNLLKSLAWLLILLTLFFLYLPALSKYLKLKREEEKLKQQIVELQAKIKTLEHEAYLIEHEPEHLEQVMRRELGLVKPGEVVYKVVPVEPEPDPARTGSSPNGTADAASSNSAQSEAKSPAKTAR